MLDENLGGVWATERLRHLAVGKKNNQPLAKLFVSLLQQQGFETDRFAGTKGTLDGSSWREAGGCTGVRAIRTSSSRSAIEQLCLRVTALRMKTADYDPFAWFYEHHWTSHYHPWAMAVLDRVLLQQLDPGAELLDLCCGTGALARELEKRGHRVLGVDASAGMLRYARAGAPRSRFVRADARRIALRPRFDAAVCTFDSLNHFLEEADLEAVFRNVANALRAGGRFVFDVNLEDAYLHAWRRSGVSLGEEHACFVRGQYDPKARIGQTFVTLFRAHRGWRRYDSTLLQRYHPPDRIETLLRQAGFAEVRSLDVPTQLGVAGHFGIGRAVFVADRQVRSSTRRGAGSRGSLRSVHVPG